MSALKPQHPSVVQQRELNGGAIDVRNIAARGSLVTLILHSLRLGNEQDFCSLEDMLIGELERQGHVKRFARCYVEQDCADTGSVRLAVDGGWLILWPNGVLA